MAINLNIYNQKAEKTGTIEISEKIFDLEANESLVHQAVVAQNANERQVLAHTKDRSEVRGGGRKPWRQKGTGRARAGSNRSPIWIGGGITFGPLKTRNFKKKINKKMKQKALLMVVSDKIRNNKIAVLDNFQLDEFKTKDFDNILKAIETKIFKIKEKPESSDQETKNGEKTKKKRVKRSVLIINYKNDDKIKYSGRNLPGVKIININNINIVDVLKYRNLIITKKAILEMESKYQKK